MRKLMGKKQEYIVLFIQCRFNFFTYEIGKIDYLRRNYEKMPNFKSFLIVYLTSLLFSKNMNENEKSFFLEVGGWKLCLVYLHTFANF